MAIYSHSRINTFETCPYQYKLKYVDRIKPEIQNTIEAFMGDMVHQTLEELYKRKKFHKKISKPSIIKFYNDLWKWNYSEDIKIVKKDLTEENYRKMGEEFIKDYYEKYYPFNQLTILGLETQDRMELPDGNKWHVRIDKFACDNKGNYYVIDYKTNSRMKNQEEADSDRQLAMYSIWVKNKFPDAKSVKLVWHMLAFNKEVVSERTDKELKELQQEIVNKILEIKNTKKFPRKTSALCNYCGYKNICPSFKHERELETKKEVKEFKKDDGLKLVDKYSMIKSQLSDLKDEEEKLKNELVEFAKQKDIDTIYGSNMKCSVKEFDRIKIKKENKPKLIQMLKEKGLYDTYSMLCTMRFNSHLINEKINDEDIKKLVETIKDFRLSLSKKK